jgi:hypothetical protein
MLTRELVAVEIVRMLVGSIGLVAAVPITTGLAALVLGTGEVHWSDDGFRQAPWRDTPRRPQPVSTGRPAPAAGAGGDGRPLPG